MSKAWKRSEKIRERKTIFRAITRNTIAAFQLRDQAPIALIFPNTNMPLAPIKAILRQPHAMIIASRLHYTMILLAINKIT
jgi:hypothetical protein